jgi:hypothetical protein
MLQITQVLHMPDEDLKMDYKVVNVRAYPQPQLHRLPPGGPLPGERASYLGMYFLIHSLTHHSVTHAYSLLHYVSPPCLSLF